MRKRMRFSVPGLLAAAVLALASLGSAADSGLKPGSPFPALSSFALEGELPKDLKGKVVLIDFWASWCGPCKGTFPLMEGLHRRFGKRGLVIIAVNEDKSEAAMKEFLKQHTATFTVVRDSGKKLAAAVKVPALPASYLLDGEGKIVSIHTGARMVKDSKEFVRQVEDLMARTGAPK